MKVIIIGGGVAGLNSAWYLRQKGYEVTVIDSNTITTGCSFGNMGYVSPSHFIPLATPGIVAKGLRWMLSASSPFYIKPRLNWELIRWGLSFWKNANARQVAQSVPHLNNLLQLTRSAMNGLRHALSEPFDMTEKGIWMLWKNEKTGDHEKQLADEAATYGLKTVICNAAEVQAYETKTEVAVAGGVLYLDDCHLNPAKFMQSLYASLQKAGVQFLLQTEVSGFEKANGKISAVLTGTGKITGDEFVIANGSWMQQTAKQLGVYVPVQPGKGYSVVYNNVADNLCIPSILVDDRVATTPIGNWLRIGGTMELSGHSHTILPKRVTAIYQAFKKYYPGISITAPDTQTAWYGYRPVSPDGMPYIGRHKELSNVVFAGGHAMLGVSAAAGTGLLVTQIIAGETPAIDLTAFNPARFG